MSPHTHDLLNSTKTYYYRITATNFDGTSPMSAVKLLRPLPAKPLPPTGLRSLSGNTKAIIFWDPSAGATSYNLYWSTSPTVTTSSTKITNANSPHAHTFVYVI